MKISTLTLQSIKDELPAHLVGRYSIEKFPVSKFNEISSHLEKYADTPYMTDYMIIPKEDGISMYRLNDKVRQPRGVYEIVSGTTVPDEGNPVRFKQLGNDLRMDYAPTVSDGIHTEDREIYGGPDSTLKTLYDVGNDSPLEEDEDLTGKAIIITYADGTSDHRIIASNDSDVGSVRVDRELSQIPSVEGPDTYSIYNDFWILEYTIYFPRVTGLASSINIPQDFEYVYKWGMLLHYYLQDGENQTEINRYEKKFENEKTKFCSDQNRHRSDNFIVKPRCIPTPFSQVRGV